MIPYVDGDAWLCVGICSMNYNIVQLMYVAPVVVQCELKLMCTDLHVFMNLVMYGDL